MFSNKSSFELFDSLIEDAKISGDTVVLKCLYMKTEPAIVTFAEVRDVENYAYLKGNTISYIKALDDGYEVHYVNEEIAPTVIRAKSHNIEWR